MNEDKTLIPMKSSDSGKTVEETRQINLKINCTEEMLNRLAVATNHPWLVTISYISPTGQVECWWQHDKFPPADVEIALETLSKDLHEKYIDRAAQKPKIVPPPRRRK